MAVRLGLSENVQILLGAGAKTNVKDKSDLTVIDYLADPRLEKMLQRLMEMGKDKYIRNIILERCVVRLRDPEDMRKVYVRVMHNGQMTTGVSSTDCGHSGDMTCTQRNGGGADRSRWCASETGGCCLRVQPPAKNQFRCCTSLDVHNFYNCSNSWCLWSDNCKGILNDYCASTDNIAGPTCQLFCSKVENKALCDPTMRKYCETVAAPSDPLCACIRSDKDGIPAPSCFSAPCTSGGYQTLDHVNQATRCLDFCGAIIDCASTEGCEINDNSFETYCCQRHPDLCKNNGGGGGGDSFW